MTLKGTERLPKTARLRRKASVGEFHHYQQRKRPI